MGRPGPAHSTHCFARANHVRRCTSDSWVVTRTHLFCSSQLEVIHVRRRLGSSWHTTGRDHVRDSGCGRHGADSDESPSLRAWPLVSSSYLPRQFNLTRKFQLSLGLGYTRRPGPGPPAPASRLDSTLGPPTCAEPDAGPKTAPLSSVTCPAPIWLPARHKLCPYIRQVRRGGPIQPVNEKIRQLIHILTHWYVLLRIIDLPEKGSTGMPVDPFWRAFSGEVYNT